MLNSLTYSLPEDLENAIRQIFDEWQMENKIARIWKQDATVWTNEDEAKWLGWLDVVEKESSDLQKYRDFAEDVKNFKHIVFVMNGRQVRFVPKFFR